MTTPLGTTGTPATTSTGAAAVAAAKKAGESAMGPDAFMKLLVAQLKYQNPMAPTDGQAYMTQMATFTQVEKLDSLVKAQAEAVQWQQRVSAEGLVGRGVTGTTDGVTHDGTVVGVRYAQGTTLLELSDGTTLAPDAVTRVQAAAAATTATTTTAATGAAPAPLGTAAGTPVTGTTGGTASTSGTSSTSGTTSTTAAPAGTPSA